MSGIFGLIRRDGEPVSGSISTIRSAMPEWGRHGFGEWSDGCAGLGQARTFLTPECPLEALPAHDRAAGFVFTAAGRLDNREALIADLGLRDGACTVPGIGDGALMMSAYRRWGENAPARILGDWSFAAWHPQQRKLFVARDQFGYTALYYHYDERTLAFSSSQRALLALGLTPIELDELYLAQYLISWTKYQGEQTASSALRRLPPAHTLTVTPGRVQTACYWRMGEQQVLRLPTRADYAEALREIFDEAVRARLRCGETVGAMLSGGLDSGAVAVTAAEILRERDQRLMAFTSVPIAPTRSVSGRRSGDELPLASATAAAAGNIDITPVAAPRLSPIAAIRRALQLFGAPIHAAANLFWMIELHELAQQAGCHVLLNGGLGNAGISWRGDPLSQPLASQLRELGISRWFNRRIQRALPSAVTVPVARRRLDPEWYRETAIAPEFAQRMMLAERRLRDPDRNPRTPLDRRLAALMPGRATLGAITAELGVKFGIDVRDPTSDIRVLAFSLSVPDTVFRDANDGSGRWLIREAMRGRLPDNVRLNRRRGLQAADLTHRLRSSAREVDDALDELDAGPAAAYVDVTHMRATWRTIQREDTPDSYRAAVAILTRGIMGGLHANAVSRGEVLGISPG